MKYTEQVRIYISRQFSRAKEQGKDWIELSAKEIHEELGFNKRYPIVCNAMQQMMTDIDEYINLTPSGQSSTIIIKYYLKDK